ASQSAADNKGTEQSRSKSDSDEHSALTKDKSQNVTAAGAEGKPNAELACPLGDNQRHDAVKPNARENQRESRKYTEQRHCQALRSEAVIDIFLHRRDIGNGLVTIQRRELVFDRTNQGLRDQSCFRADDYGM